MSSTRSPRTGGPGLAVSSRASTACGRAEGRLDASALPSRGAGSGGRRSPRRAGRAGVDSPRRPVGFGDEGSTAAEMLEGRDVRAIGDRCIGDAKGRGQVEHLIDGVRRRSTPRWSGPAPCGRRRAEGSSVHSGCSTMAQKSSHCCPVPTPEPDQPVACGPDTRGGDEAASPHRPTELVVERHRVVGEAHRQRLEHRDVDELAARIATPARRQGADGGEEPASHSPIWPPTYTGARSGLPRASPTTAPDQAWSVNSVAGLSRQGPRVRTG